MTIVTTEVNLCKERKKSHVYQNRLGGAGEKKNRKKQ